MKSLKTNNTFCIYYAIFSAIFLYNLLVLFPSPSEMHSYCINFYFSTYENGFISRGFIGTILKLLFPILPAKTLYIIIGANILVLIFVTVSFLVWCIKNCKPSYQHALIYLCFAFCVNPGSIAYLFYWGNYGRFDMYLILILIACCMCIIKKTYIPILILSICGILIHQVFLFLFFPAIALMYFYSIQNNKKAYAGFFLTLAVVFLLALYLQFFGSPNSVSWEDLLETAQNRTDWHLSPDPFRKEYSYTLYDHLNDMPADVLLLKLKKTVGVLFCLSPLIWIFILIWKNTICSAKKKWIYYLFILSPICTLPTFVMVDWGRWFAAIIISQFILIFFLTVQQDRNLTDSLCIMTTKMNRNWPVYAVVLLLLSIPGKFEAANILSVPIDQMFRLWHLVMP